MPDKSRSNTKLTDTRVRELKATGKQYRLWDSVIPGFHALIQPSGSKSYRVQFQRVGGSKVSLTIGDANAWGVKEAREKARILRQMHEEGRDPQAHMKEERSGKTLEMLADLWREDYKPRLKPSTRPSYESLLKNIILPSLGKRLVKDLGLADVKALYRETRRATPIQANRAIAVLSKLLTIAEIEQWLPPGINPCHRLEREDEKPKTRVLSALELAALEGALKALVAEDKLEAAHADLVRFLALSGLRRGEALGLKWKDIDRERATMTFEEHKTDSEGVKVLPLNRHLLRLLDERQKQRLSIFVFPGLSPDRQFNGMGKVWDRIRVKAGIMDITPHDLRRTFNSVCSELNNSALIGDALLGHSLGRIRDTYNQFGPDGALAKASQVTADWIEAALAGQAPKAGVRVRHTKKVTKAAAA
jgi:integrase